MMRRDVFGRKERQEGSTTTFENQNGEGNETMDLTNTSALIDSATASTQNSVAVEGGQLADEMDTTSPNTQEGIEEIPLPPTNTPNREEVSNNSEVNKKKKKKRKKDKKKSKKDEAEETSFSGNGSTEDLSYSMNENDSLKDSSGGIAVAIAPINKDNTVVIPNREFEGGAMGRVLNSRQNAKKSIRFNNSQDLINLIDPNDDSDDGDEERGFRRRVGDGDSSDLRSGSLEESMDMSYDHLRACSNKLDKLRKRSKSFKDISNSEKFDNMQRSDDVETYPADCYSFMMIHHPLKEPFFFCFGFMVFVFQVLFLLYMILNKMDQRWGINGEIDNPSSNFFAQFIPSNVTALTRATQVTAVLSYCMFADSSLKDCVAAVEQFPRFDRVKKDDQPWLIVLSCILKFTQGFLATCATFLLIVTTSDVIEIILNFAAVNFISTLDEAAFELAKWGKYGPRLAKEAISIEERPLPFCMYRKYVHVRFLATIIPITMVLVSIMIIVAGLQLSDKFWVTQTLRVQFQDRTGLQSYSGCYHLDKKITHNRRKNYNSHEKNPKVGVFGYCKETRQWRLFKNEGNGTLEGEGGVDKDPCQVSRENELAHSASTDFFDISSSFDEAWFTAGGTPLDLYFFDTDNMGKDLEDTCGSFLDNGECNLYFNDLGNDYDGGDCCAATCTHTNCGIAGSDGAFGSSNLTEGIGYRHCVDPDMVPITILLNNISSSRDPSVLRVTNEQEDEYFRERGKTFWDETPVTPLFIVDCDGVNVLSLYIDKYMEGQNETIMVKDGARCKVSVSNTTNFFEKWDNDPIWWVDYSFYHGNSTTNEIMNGYSGDISTKMFHRIPECYFEQLESYIEVSSAYSESLDSTLAIDWLINDESGNSKCDDNFLIERFALASLNSAAPIVYVDGSEISEDTDSSIYHNNFMLDEKALWITEEQQCRWDNIACHEGSVETLAVRSQNLQGGTISTSIGLLTGLRRLDYDNNGMVGTIPTEIGMLTNLQGLDIDNQTLTGTIPTEFGNFGQLLELDLDKNLLTGTIPTEFGLMTNAREFDLIYNKLSGPIPTELGKLYAILTLGFEGNQLSGTVPTEIGEMSALQGLHFHKNNLNGTIPVQIGDAAELKDLWLGENVMTGTIPSEIGELRKLTSLRLQDNNFRGTISTDIGKLTSLVTIDLSGNSFTGQIPSEIGFLTNLRELRLDGNEFDGSIPLEITYLEGLRILTTDPYLAVEDGSVLADVKTP